MKSKTKTDADSPLRVPKAKNKLGLRIPRIALPHDDLISPEKPRLEAVVAPPAEALRQPEKKRNGTTGITDTTTATVENKRHPVSPVKDFTKTPNSITRLLLTQSLFRGKSKRIYDYLWSNSRGAVVPVRSLKKTHKEIQKGAGIGSRNTIISGLKHLQNIGLIKFNSAVGEPFGNEYEIFTPEELGYPSYTTFSGTTGMSQLYQKLVIPVQPVSGTTGITQTVENKDSYDSPKTFFKDKDFKSDDDAYDAMRAVLTTACEKIGGKVSGKSQKENWRELAELLVAELEMAAALTKNVSNVPAFLTEHLRRRLHGKKSSPEAKSKKLSTPATTGAAPNENYEAEPLTERGRETVLKTFREYLERGQAEFVLSLEETYTGEDWRFLMEKLETEKPETE